MFHSISWRLQFSYGLLLFVAFVGLLVAAHHLEYGDRMSEVDSVLQARAVQIRSAITRPRGAEAAPGEQKVPELALPRSDNRFGPARGARHTYYFVWEDDASPEPEFQSNGAPGNVEQPFVEEGGPGSGISRVRGEYRERIIQTRGGITVLVGRDVTELLVEVRKQSMKLAAAGSVLLLIGLLAGNWVVRRSLRPIDDISEAAIRIAGGELDERIETKGNRTELGKLGDVLNHTFDELETAYKRQAQFTADASHELRTPVAVILSEIQSAPKRSRSVEEYEECLAVCEESATSMQQLLQQLMALAQFDAGEAIHRQDSVDLNELVERCVDQIAPIAAEKNVVLSVESSEATIPGDPDRISQVVTNLLGNAIAYNREGGAVAISLFEKAGDAVIEVADTGVGIPPDDLPHVFERFYRADKARSAEGEHNGLGLAISKEIAKAHGGDISVESRLDEGSTFTVRLPKHKAEKFSNLSSS